MLEAFDGCPGPTNVQNLDQLLPTRGSLVRWTILIVDLPGVGGTSKAFSATSAGSCVVCPLERAPLEKKTL